jgi:tripartite-type tricarboxylate transporter receptor subunit TctC
MQRRSILGLIGAPAFASLAELARAQAAWPSRPVTIVSPYVAGGTTDILGRLLGAPLQEKLGQPFIVDNRPGAGGNVGTDYVSKAKPDGYTIMVDSMGPIAISPTLYSKLPYNPLTDLTCIAPLARAPFVIAVNAASGITSIKDLIAKGKSGNLNFATAGAGTPQHIIGEMFNQAAGIKMQHIPYKGSGPAMTDLLGNQVPVSFENPVPAMPHVKDGKIKVLASTGAQRSAAFPDVPTVSELGLAGFDAKPWYGLLAPAGLDPSITQRLNEAVRETLATPDIKAKLSALGAEPMSMSPAEYKTYVEGDLVKWTKAVKASGATAD